MAHLLSFFANGFKLVGARSAEEIQAVWKELGL